VKKQGYAFEFDLPDGWTDDSRGQQDVAHGPRDEELIVSGSVITGPLSRNDLASVRDAVLRNAFQAVQEAASVPELTVTKGLAKEEHVTSGLEQWTIHAQTIDGGVAFLQGVIAADAAVMIATMEGPNEEPTAEAFQSFLKGVRPAAKE
jgi:hypothetical protein